MAALSREPMGLTTEKRDALRTLAGQLVKLLAMPEPALLIAPNVAEPLLRYIVTGQPDRDHASVLIDAILGNDQPSRVRLHDERW